MRKNNIWLMVSLLMGLVPSTMDSQVSGMNQLENLGRGLVVSRASKGNFISWRLLATDDASTTFDVLRDSILLKGNINKSTNHTDTYGTVNHKYQVVTKVNGEPVDTTAAVAPWGNVYYQLHLDLPTANGYTYSPNDCSVGDVDGDGEYELFVKWDPSNSKDNSQSGITGNVYLDCYKVDWSQGGIGATPTKLWRVDLGVNIRAGAHYTQFMVYDFDGDGCAEMMCKTAPGSKDGLGEYVSAASTDNVIIACDNKKNWRDSAGKIQGGYEFLTVFDGISGKAIHTVFYKPNRNAAIGGSEAKPTFNWDDRSDKTDNSYGNRGERYLAAVAHLDGVDKNASAVFVRGYYTYAYLWAVTFDGKQIIDKWYHSSHSKTQYKVTDADGNTQTYTPPAATSGSGSRTMYGNGNHNLSVADVDGDGADEIVWGSAALDHDGTLLYATGYGHGDAIHLADHNPDRPGLEVFEIHEGSPYGWDLHDAATGEILFKATGSGDNGRGMAGQFSADHRGSFFSSANDRQQRSAVTGAVISTGQTSTNFRIYWDGDLQEELFDGGKIDKWTGSGTSRLYINGKNPYDYNTSSTCNGSKSTPNLQADILGDWREELILWSSNDNSTLNVFTTNTSSNFRVPTLMHDHTYRMGVAWQNVAYNQPPHIGYYLPDSVGGRIFLDVASGETEQTIELGDSITPIIFHYKNATGVSKSGTYASLGITVTIDKEAQTVTIQGTPTKVGTARYTLKTFGNDMQASVTGKIIVNEPSGINSIDDRPQRTVVYDLFGREVENPTNGIYIINGHKVWVE